MSGPSAQTRPSLAVCMIVRDEAEVLRPALECARAWADQVVVLDTGSRDGSDRIARELGAEVGHFEWCDDFAAARNAALSLARTDWVFVLDADEWIGEADRARVRAALEGPRDRAYLTRQHNYVADASTPGFEAGRPPAVWTVEAPGYVVARQVRLIPNDPRLRYEGRVHEQLDRSLERAGVEVERLDVVVHHLGKIRDAEVMARKAAVYHRLGELKLQEQPDGRALLELGTQCIELGELDRAVELLERCLEVDEAAGDRAKAVAHLAGVLVTRGEADRADRLIRDHLEQVAGHALVWERWGSVLAAAGRMARAAEVLGRAARLFPRPAGILRLLGEAQLALRQYGEARRTYQALMEIAPEGGLGVAGHAVAAAGAGDPAPLRRILRRPESAVAAAARAGAVRWLEPDWILRAWPRGVEAPGPLLGMLRERLLARDRRGFEGAGLPRPAPSTLEALWRAGRTDPRVSPEVRERLGRAVQRPGAVLVPG